MYRINIRCIRGSNFPLCYGFPLAGVGPCSPQLVVVIKTLQVKSLLIKASHKTSQSLYIFKIKVWFCLYYLLWLINVYGVC